MNAKSLIWLFVFIGSAVGGFIPTLWGASYLSFWSVLFTAIGGLIGIYLAYKLTNF